MDTAKRGIRVQRGQDRFNERTPIGARSSIDRKVSGRDTEGKFLGWSLPSLASRMARLVR
jgi:hypothetical protein